MKIKCQNCGGNIKFIPEKQLIICENCKSEFLVSDFKNAYENIIYENNRCSSCGANLITEENTLITICPYCNSNQLIKTKFEQLFKPSKIIPFKFGNAAFHENFNKNINSKKFIPDDFLNNINFSKIVGIYVPFKKTNLSGFSKNRGRALNRIYDSETRKYSYYIKDFEYEFEFDSNIVFDISNSFDNNYTNEIGPFDFSDETDYNPAYLCGFSAQTGNDTNDRQILTNEILKISDEILTKKLQEVTDDTFGYTMNLETKEKKSGYVFNGGVKSINFEIKNETNVLLPIWFIQYKYKSKEYMCMMNGQTGKIIGDVPISKFKVFMYVAKFSIIGIFCSLIFLFLITKDIIARLIFIIYGLIFICYLKK